MNYPPPNVWSKVEIEAESEPELVQVCRSPELWLPASWSPEHRSDFLFVFTHDLGEEHRHGG